MRGWCAKFIVHIIGRGVRDECVSPSFPVIEKVRQTRSRWLGHVLRADRKNLVRQAIIKVRRGCIGGVTDKMLVLF